MSQTLARVAVGAALVAALSVGLVRGGGVAAAAADGRAVLVQSTTSTANSGLYDHLLPLFEATSGLRVDVVAVGTGQAIRNARHCDADVLLVHATAAEEAFVADGFGVERFDLMYNDFVIVGPGDDPAGIAGAADASSALARIAAAGRRGEALFASRGDDSGTHVRERALWDDANVDPSDASGTWYRETGSGMGPTLNTGIGMGAYVMSDRATWIGFANKADFAVLVEGDPAMFNQYGLVPVAADACPDANVVGARAFVDWLLSEAGQSAIAAHRIDGRQLFFPNAVR